MKKIALLALAASTAAIATPAMAQTNAVGTINITGTVGEKCTVLTGQGVSQTWGTDVDMGELSDVDGTLKDSSVLETTFLTQANGLNVARVICTTLNPKIAVDADPLVNATSVASSPGYVNTVHFQADVEVVKVSSNQTYSNDSNAAPGTAVALGSALKASGDNVTISTSNWRTLTNNTEQLVAGSYLNGKIVVTISPS